MKGIHARMILINKCNTLTISVHGLNKSKIIYLTFELYEKIKDKESIYKSSPTLSRCHQS